MLTPKFACSQTKTHVVIHISVSHIRFDAPGVQVLVDDTLVIFSLSPYYLRLRFDKPLIDDEDHPAKAEYVSKDETVIVNIPKMNPGDVFKDLDLPKKLMARMGEEVVDSEHEMDTKTLLQEIGVDISDKAFINETYNDLQNQKERVKGPLIEVLDESKSDVEKAALEGDAFNWEINQKVEEDTVLKVKYGFNSMYDSIIAVSISNGNDINELDDPEHTTPEDRIKERLLKENCKFDPEYYAADYMTTKYADEDDYSQVRDLLKWENPLFVNDDFTDEENSKMMELPKKSYLVTNPKSLYYAIVSLLFSYCFEMRETEGELNTESAWCIGKLTPQISCLDQQIIMDDVTSVPILKAIVITSIRRALSYPLHRNFELAFKAWLDAIRILKSGKKTVLKALLALHEPFRFHDIYYVYNKILIDDLINWLINDSRDNEFVLKSLGGELSKQLMTLEKNEIVFEQLDDDGDVDTHLNILEIEQIAEEMYRQGQEES